MEIHVLGRKYYDNLIFDSLEIRKLVQRIGAEKRFQTLQLTKLTAVYTQLRVEHPSSLVKVSILTSLQLWVRHIICQCLSKGTVHSAILEGLHPGHIYKFVHTTVFIFIPCMLSLAMCCAPGFSFEVFCQFDLRARERWTSSIKLDDKIFFMSFNDWP